MAYLTNEEYKKLGFKEVSDVEFNKLLPKASAVLDNVTSHFYQKVDIKEDNEWRVRQFKKGLGSQIEYFNVLGATTSEEINSSPHSFTAGRTSVSNSSRYNTSGENEKKPLVAEDVYIYLEGTGLLYSGVATW